MKLWIIIPQIEHQDLGADFPPIVETTAFAAMNCFMDLVNKHDLKHEEGFMSDDLWYAWDGDESSCQCFVIDSSITPEDTP